MLGPRGVFERFWTEEEIERPGFGRVGFVRAAFFEEFHHSSFGSFEGFEILWEELGWNRGEVDVVELE